MAPLEPAFEKEPVRKTGAAASVPGRSLRGPLVVLTLLGGIAAASAVMLPVLTTPAEPFRQQALARLWACPRATHLLGERAQPVFSLFPGVYQHGKAKTHVDGSGWASWTMAVEGAEGRGTYRFRLRRLQGRWEMESGHLLSRGEAVDVLSCAAGATTERR
jgi:hypothetical protein